MDNKKLVERALKLYALSVQGLQGEKDSAENMLVEFLRKHHEVSLEEIKILYNKIYNIKESISNKKQDSFANPIVKKQDDYNRYLNEMKEGLKKCFEKFSKSCDQFHFIFRIDDNIPFKEMVTKDNLDLFFADNIDWVSWTGWEYLSKNNIYNLVVLNDSVMEVNVYRFILKNKPKLTDDQLNGRIMNSKGTRDRKRWFELSKEGIEHFLK